eukprot:TRINITY_DN55116_c0_g1_i1.p1 TRINITY_DN55116_c0_g1~~TRINITY_DN55116_c0_g1_i1.p1  ORF type:complete len:676 (+),score=175.09 TRINITY_DN55116_c0_g1_i1:80-2029(+)
MSGQRGGGARGQARARSRFRSTGAEGQRRSLFRQERRDVNRDAGRRRPASRLVGQGRYRIFTDEVVGQGAWSTVCKALSVETNRLIVAKIVRKDCLRDSPGDNEVLREVAVLRHLPRHRHVVEFIDLVEEGSEYCLMLESVSNGDLCDAILESEEGRVPENLARRFFRQVTEALICCHRYGVTHRDCKPENVLLSDCQELKLTDFGLARIFPEPWRCRPEDMPSDLVGTLRYAAPEVFQGHFEGKPYDPFIADVWSLGVCLYVMLTGAFPFSVGTEVDEEKTRDALYNSDPEPPEDCSADACGLLSCLLEKDPSRRIDLREVLAHPWLGGGTELRDKEADMAARAAHILELEQMLGDLEGQLRSAEQEGKRTDALLAQTSLEEQLCGENGLRRQVSDLRRRNSELSNQWRDRTVSPAPSSSAPSSTAGTPVRAPALTQRRATASPVGQRRPAAAPDGTPHSADHRTPTQVRVSTPQSQRSLSPSSGARSAPRPASATFSSRRVAGWQQAPPQLPANGWSSGAARHPSGRSGTPNGTERHPRRQSPAQPLRAARSAPAPASSLGAATFRPGDLVLYTDRTDAQCEAYVRFCGPIDDSGQHMVGIEVVRSTRGSVEGKHDGRPHPDGPRYFTCAPDCGLLVAPARCRPLTQ